MRQVNVRIYHKGDKWRISVWHYQDSENRRGVRGFKTCPWGRSTVKDYTDREVPHMSCQECPFDDKTVRSLNYPVCTQEWDEMMQTSTSFEGELSGWRIGWSRIAQLEERVVSCKTTEDAYITLLEWLGENEPAS
jgi:hypothetical protein